MKGTPRFSVIFASTGTDERVAARPAVPFVRRDCHAERREAGGISADHDVPAFPVYFPAVGPESMAFFRGPLRRFFSEPRRPGH